MKWAFIRHFAALGEGREDRAGGTHPWPRRRYDLSKLRHLAPHVAPSSRTTIAYGRVSTVGQKDDLARQVALLESYCAAKFRLDR